MNRRALLAAALLSVAGAARASAPSGGGAQPTYLGFPTLTATVARPGGGRGVMSVEAGLDIADGPLMEQATAIQPRIRAAYAQALQSFAAALLPGLPPDADRLAGVLQQATDR
ncbi:MAG TPA: Tat pathway signal protein, partial [Caulobacteraceae bacterium]